MEKDKLVELIRKMRDTCDQLVKALVNEEEDEIESALGRFMLLMMQMNAME